MSQRWPMPVFHPGRQYRTRSGQMVALERIENGTIYGSAYAGAVKFEWHLDGVRKPRGGTDPFDLIVEKD